MIEQPAVPPGLPLETQTCPVCGVPQSQFLYDCPGCQKRGVQRIPPEPMRLQFGIGSLMLLTALVAVVLGSLMAVPCVGVPLLLLAPPAYVRTCVSVARLQARGQSVTMGEQVTMFVGSLGVVSFSVMALSVALFGTCAITMGSAGIASTAGGEHAFVALLIILLAVATLTTGLWLIAHIVIAIVRGLWPIREHADWFKPANRQLPLSGPVSDALPVVHGSPDVS